MQDIVLISIPETTIRSIVEQAVKKALSDNQTPPQSNATLPELLTRREAADLAGVCLATIDNKVRDGVLKKYRTGGIVRFKRQEIIEAFSQSPMTKTYRRGASRTAAGKKP